MNIFILAGHDELAGGIHETAQIVLDNAHQTAVRCGCDVGATL